MVNIHYSLPCQALIYEEKYPKANVQLCPYIAGNLSIVHYALSLSPIFNIVLTRAIAIAYKLCFVAKHHCNTETDKAAY